MALIKPQVVSQLLVKNQSGYNTPMNIGPELRFCGALPNSGVNNLEEQLLFGTNCVIKEQYNTVDEDEYPCNIITTEYKDSADNNSNYYKIVKYNYSDNPKPSSILVEPANLYAWVSGDAIVYTSSSAPEVNNKVYNRNGDFDTNFNPILEVGPLKIKVLSISSSIGLDFTRNESEDIRNAYKFRIDFKDLNKIEVDGNQIVTNDTNYIIVNNQMANFSDVPITSLEKLYYISNSNEELVSIKTEQITSDNEDNIIRIISISNVG